MRLTGRFLGVAAIVAVVAQSPSCSHDEQDECGVGSVDFPRICTGEGYGCPGGGPYAICMITGLASHVVDATAPAPVRARIQVGDQLVLTAHCICGCLPAPTSYGWASSDPAIADLRPIGAGPTSDSNLVYLVGLAPGEITVQVDMSFAAGTGVAPYRANLAYCPPGDVNNCNPKRVAPVEVLQ